MRWWPKTPIDGCVRIIENCIITKVDMQIVKVEPKLSKRKKPGEIKVQLLANQVFRLRKLIPGEKMRSPGWPVSKSGGKIRNKGIFHPGPAGEPFQMW